MKKLILFIVVLFSFTVSAQNLGLYFAGKTDDLSTGLKNYSFGGAGGVSFPLSQSVSTGLDASVFSNADSSTTTSYRIRGDYYFADWIYGGVGFGFDVNSREGVSENSVGIGPSLGLKLLSGGGFDFIVRSNYNFLSNGNNNIRFWLGIRSN